MNFEQRIRSQALKNKIMTPYQASLFVQNGMTVATSGFTPSGYPKVVPLAIAERAKNGEKIEITLITGASVGEELDGALTKEGVIVRRFPYQTNESCRNAINNGRVHYADMHLSHVSQYMDYGFFGDIDVAIIEAIAINEDGGIVPSTSVGVSPQAIKNAKVVIVEINTAQPMSLEGVHDIYMTQKPPFRKAIPIEHAGDRIGTTFIPCDPNKIVAIVHSNLKDRVRPLGQVDEDSRAISKHIMHFLENEVETGRLPENLLPLQSGVGSVANAVMAGLVESKFKNLTCYTEVIQDCILDLIDAGKVTVASGTSFTPSEEGLSRLLNNMDHYSKYCVIRPMEISNNPEVARRLGVISMNTAIEVDIFGHVNSTNIMGSRMMNGIGGSGDFTRNAFISIFTTVSTAKGGDISSIVPMVSHVDHTEHDVQVVVTELGYADLRGKSPVERAKAIIENCAHPDYQPMLRDYLERAQMEKPQHEPHLIGEALSMHERFIKTGSMKMPIHVQEVKGESIK